VNDGLFVRRARLRRGLNRLRCMVTGRRGLPTRPSLLFAAIALNAFQNFGCASSPAIDEPLQSGERAQHHGKHVQVLIYIIVICLVCGVLFRVVHNYERNRRMAVFLELLVVGVGFAAILRQLLH
jgi:hypothetical protein